VPPSKPSLKKVAPVDEELEELLDELLLDEELELEVPEEEELELLLEELLEEELLDEELELLLEVGVSPAQVGAIKLPSWVPWNPKTLLAV
jgi:hypothetical protein